MIHRRIAVSGLLLMVCVSGVCAAAPSRRSRAAQIKARQEQAAYMQLEMIRYQAEVAQMREELYRSFDANGDGKLGAGEKSRFESHMHAIETGKEPNPFAMILPVGKGPRPKSPLDELKKRATEYQSDLVAKQNEIFNSFDEDGDGQLEGREKAQFDKHMHDIQTGKVPNPFAALAAPGHAPAGSSAPKK